MTKFTGRVALLLFGSGLCALMFQLIWNREFSLIFGGASTATAAVTAVFMGGLGLGNWLLGGRADRTTNPLRMYGLLEFAIAASAAASPFLLDGATMVYVALGGQESLGEFGATFVRLLLTVLIVGLPTFLMGGTLAAAVKSVESAQDERRLSTAILYGANTLGAVAGALANTFLLLPFFGVRGVLWSFCGLNLLIAGAALWTARDVSPKLTDPTQPVRRKGEVERPAATTFLYIAAGTTGFAFFLLELVWFRLLGAILGGTVFTFGLILAVALFGIGLGGLFHSLFFRRVPPGYSILAATCLLEAACVAYPFALGDTLPIWSAALQSGSESFFASVAGWTIIAAVVVLPASFVSGVQFPLLISLLGSGDRSLGTQLGRAFAWNTVGAIAGSLAGGFGLLPLLTAPLAWVLVVIVLAILGAAGCLVALRRGEKSPPAFVVALASGAAAAYFLTATGPTAFWRHSGVGVGRMAVSKDPIELENEIRRCRRGLLEEADGVQAGIGLMKDSGLAFYVNGKCDGHAVGDAGTQIMLGLLSALLHPNPEQCFVVGLGTGESAGWLAEVPSVKKVVVAELEPAIDRMAELCAPVNHNVLRHPRVERVYNDAREVLMTTSAEFDLIVSEPSNPYRPGVANLFTQEFYRACNGRLRSGGMFVQWLQGYDIDEPTIAIIVKTLKSVFPAVEIWQSRQDDMLLVCYLEPPRHRPSDLALRVGKYPFRDALRCAWRERSLEGVFARFVGNDDLATMLAAEAPRVNTDDWNTVSYSFARTLGRLDLEIIARLRERAIAAGMHRPRTAPGETLRESVVDGHWQVARAMPAGKIWLPPNADAGQRLRAQLLEAYWKQDMAGVVRIFEDEAYDRDHQAPDENAIVALAYADIGGPRVKDDHVMFNPDHGRSPDAHAIAAYDKFRRGDMDSALHGLEELCKGLRRDPWAFPHAVELVILSASKIAAARPDLAPRIYGALREPFAVYAFENHRLAVLWQVAAFANLEAALDALAQHEPHVPWDRAFLQFRRQVYAATNHPRSAEADRDWERFLHMSASAR